MKFNGIEIWDDTGLCFYTDVEISEDNTHNRAVDVKVSKNNKFPYAIRDGEASYWTGTINGLWLDNSEGACKEDFNLDTSTAWIVALAEWLHNGKPKRLKLSEDWIMTVEIQSEVQLNCETSVDVAYNNKLSCSWVQTEERYTSDNIKPLHCPKCNTTVVPTAVYCQKCGTKLVNSV